MPQAIRVSCRFIKHLKSLIRAVKKSKQTCIWRPVTYPIAKPKTPPANMVPQNHPEKISSEEVTFCISPAMRISGRKRKEALTLLYRDSCQMFSSTTGKTCSEGGDSVGVTWLRKILQGETANRSLILVGWVHRWMDYREETIVTGRIRFLTPNLQILPSTRISVKS